MQSTYKAAGFIRRLLDAALPDSVHQLVNVQLVNDRTFAGSRERAPSATFVDILNLAGAGEHNVLAIRATDAGSDHPPPIINVQRLQLRSGTALDSFSWTVLSQAAFDALTVADGPDPFPAITVDSDDEVSIVAELLAIETANLPTAAGILPNMNDVDSVVRVDIQADGALPGIFSFRGVLVLVQGIANVSSFAFLQAQAVRD